MHVCCLRPVFSALYTPRPVHPCPYSLLVPSVNLNPVPSARTLHRYPPPCTLHPVPSTRALRLCPPPVPSACALREYYARTLLPYFTPQVRHNQLKLKQVCQLKLKQYENLMCPWSLRG